MAFERYDETIFFLNADRRTTHKQPLLVEKPYQIGKKARG